MTTGRAGRRLPARAASYLRVAVRRIVRRFKPERIILFGSHAYGRPRPDSDMDLLIILRTRGSAFEQEVRADQLLCDRPVPMDIVVRTPAQIDEYQSGFYPFWQEVLVKGKVLYEARR